MTQQINVEKKHVVITGASGRLGRLLVRHLGAAGAAVSRIIRDAAGVRPGSYACDLTNPEATRAVFDQLAREAGPPDAVIHTVGMWAMTPLQETSLEAWRAVIDTNLTSTFVCFREAVRVMGEKGGQLVAFASGQGADRAQANQSAYSAAKAGVVRLVESIDSELRPAGIDAFVVAPSFILYEGSGEEGVEASDLAELCGYLVSGSARSLSGSVIRAYGNRR